MSRCRLVLATFSLVPQLSTRLPAQITVVSAPGPTDYAAANAAGLTATWLIQNSSSGSVTIWLSCTRVDRLTSCSTPTNIVIPSHSTQPAIVTFATGTPGFGRVNINAHTTTCPPNACLNYNGGTNRTVQFNQSPTASSISINPTPHNGEYRDVTKCVADCFDATLSYTTPAYFSLDTPRSVTLIYRSSQAKAMGFVQIDATDTTSPAPDRMSILLKKPDGSFVTFTNGSTEIFYQSATGVSRLAAQFDASSFTTGAYDYTVVSRSWRGANSQEATYPIRVLVVNEVNSLIGPGWSLGGYQKLLVQGDASVAITEGDGSIAFFKADLCPSACGFVSPAGDFTTVATTGTYPTISGYTRGYPNGTVVAFAASGLVSSVRDRFGNQTSYGYDASSRLATITDPVGKVITLSYTGGHLSNLQDPGGRLTWIITDAFSGYNVVGIEDAMGIDPFRPSYDATHRMTQRLDRRGSPWGFAYDFAGEIAADTMPTIVADSQSVRPVRQFSSLPRAVLVDPASGLGTSGNPAPRVIPSNVRASITNPRSFSTAYTLDRFGAALRIDAPLSSSERVARNVHSQITADTSPSGHVIQNTWSGPRLTQTADLTTGRTINIDYETTYNEPTRVYGNVDTVVNVWTNGKLMSTRRSNQPATTFTYDSKGRVLTQTDPLGHLVTNYYATTGWQNTDSVIASGMKAAYTYDIYGRRVTVKDARNLVVTLQFDSLNRNLRRIGPLNDTTKIDFDSLYVRSLTDAVGQRYQYVRNALGWVETRVDPGMRQETYGYDRNGNRTRTTNRRNQVISFSYDSLDHLASRIADGSTTTYRTDPAVRFRSSSNAESNDTLKLDVAGRPQSEITVLAGTRYERRSTFDIRDLRTALEVVAPWDDTVGYRYNVNMMLDSVIDLRGGRTSLRYNADLVVDTVLLAPPNLLMSLTVQANHVYSQMTYPNAPSINSLVGLEFRTDSLGLVDAHAKVGWDTSWTTPHDALRRISEFLSQPFTFDSFYTYDKVGNRTDLGRHVVAGNRLDTFNGDSLFYDADGNLTKRRHAGADVQRLYWNSLGQLIAVWTNASDSITLGYDGFGRRVRKTSATQTVRYIWDGDDLLAEVNSGGTRLVEYVYYPGVDRPHSMRRNGPTGQTYYFAQDIPGNVVAVFDTSGGVPVARYRYSPFGTNLPGFPAGSLGSTNTLRFAALQIDVESGLYFVRGRYYDPALGRFISEDPIGLAGGMNTYSYAGNDPNNFTDPTGTSIFSVFRHICGNWCGVVLGFTAIVLSGGEFLGAIEATAATLAGSALEAGVQSLFTGESFSTAFRENFNYSEAFLGGASIAAKVFGHGVAQVGANTWFQGYVQSRGPILGGGGLTFSSASFFSGLSPQTPLDLTEPLVTYGTHEAGHTIQFIELSAFGRFAPFPYLGLGGLEVLSEHHWWDNAVGRFWNSNATFMGQGGIW